MLVCSSWLHVLPTIMERKATVPLISSSISTLGLSILSKSSGQRKWELRYMQSYCATTQALRQLLQAGARQPGHELAAAALCLSLIEALKPKFDHGWFGHVRAGAELIQLAGPRAFAEPVPLKLLIGFCPILLSEACLSQRKSFLDSDDWRRVLFSQSSPSPMLSLMSTAAIIPGLLQETAALPFQSPQHTLSVAHQLLSVFSSVLFALDQWELSLRGSTSGPLFWPGETRGSLHAGGGPPTSSIHFSDTYKAMCLMQAWAYGIECLTGIERLGSTIDGVLRTSVMSEMQSAWNRETVLGLSRKIYQSLWYFLQDDLRLYGPVSTVFPLNIAYEALLSHCPEASDDDIKGCEHAISLLSQKGFALHPRAKQS
ncbi:hypothetical protein BDV37DRAFT_15060 [Aspergillus pseudonomiae]|uniref:Fungal-specific transcription factor domain-containing protein n=1 Tax=Aspergillus pseudonomiae TaxID=1506151 RepID=A0A5N7CXU6_9EURO|nr:uncharacterized protein BDV37DRAFT_15060 [Aspergillus pseudonomiae]KAE8399024.1 hypothetical protein BDV37DRAFT_15060 [Aspergillus pseudonomiae]